MKLGHYVEVLGKGKDLVDHTGKRGVINIGNQGYYPVTFADGTDSDYLGSGQLRSSGLDVAAFQREFGEESRLARLRVACEQLPIEIRDAVV